MARRVAQLWLALACALLGVLALCDAAGAQTLSLDLGQGGGVTERALQLVALVTILSLAPTILVMVTSFTRIVVVLSLLRSAIGTQTAPPDSVVVALSLFLTEFVMAPTLREAYDTGVRPLVQNQISLETAFERASGSLRTFMLRHVREKDFTLFIELSREARPATPQQLSLATLVPAFMTLELRRAFEIGFLLFLPTRRRPPDTSPSACRCPTRSPCASPRTPCGARVRGPSSRTSALSRSATSSRSGCACSTGPTWTTRRAARERAARRSVPRASSATNPSSARCCPRA